MKNAPWYKIVYLTANQVSKVSNELAGGFSYYADPNDALNTGLFCQKLTIPVYDYQNEPKTDFLGKRFNFSTIP